VAKRGDKSRDRRDSREEREQEPEREEREKREQSTVRTRKQLTTAIAFLIPTHPAARHEMKNQNESMDATRSRNHKTSRGELRGQYEEENNTGL
jgi:hypothetical protein